MTILLALAATAIAVVAAAASTWSPCGVSMLSTITPLAERARGHRYTRTASWFVAGSIVGGASLGLVMAVLATGVRATGADAALLAAAACAACALAAAADARLGGFHLPVHRRQVNERWLDQFRPWVYGAGFGWQIGTGLVTYIKTAALYLMIVLATLTADPWVALSIGALFGLVRGLAVLLGRGITTAQALTAFHRRFTGAWPVMLRVVVASETAAAVLCAWLLSPWAAVGVVALGSGGAVVRVRGRWASPARAPEPSVETGTVRTGTVRTDTVRTATVRT
jgi:hypothetical protein